jgi:hypothetical protein
MDPRASASREINQTDNNRGLQRTRELSFVQDLQEKNGAYRKSIGRGTLGWEKSTTKLNGMETLLQLKTPRETNKNLQGHIPTQAKVGRDDPPQGGKDAGRKGGIADGRTLPRELLDNRQGMLTSSDMDISKSSKGEDP